MIASDSAAVLVPDAFGVFDDVALGRWAARATAATHALRSP